ncbi:hypothetical protein [Streptacidiphilus albus]|uniref:hypothetical protein n=1 Tax=Streptacidiphilus albus TaxID=105425 RepID=UPI00054BBEC9|nr:hypothetical protein [Streptacidiphilus albus]
MTIGMNTTEKATTLRRIAGVLGDWEAVEWQRVCGALAEAGPAMRARLVELEAWDSVHPGVRGTVEWITGEGSDYIGREPELEHDKQRAATRITLVLEAVDNVNALYFHNGHVVLNGQWQQELEQAEALLARLNKHPQHWQAEAFRRLISGTNVHLVVGHVEQVINTLRSRHDIDARQGDSIERDS